MTFRSAAFSLLLLMPSAASAQLAVTVESTAVVVTGATPGASVVLFNVARDTDGYTPIVRHDGSVLAADGSGAARAPFERLLQRALWVAVDMTSGLYAISEQEGLWRRVAVPEGTFRNGNAGADALGANQKIVVSLFARRPAGAWSLLAIDDLLNDDERSHRNVRAELRRFKGIENSNPPPPVLLEDDIVFVFDPGTLEFFGGKLTRRAGGGFDAN